MWERSAYAMSRCHRRNSIASLNSLAGYWSLHVWIHNEETTGAKGSVRITWMCQLACSTFQQCGDTRHWIIMRKHYKRCVSVCVCLCMHRYPKHRSSNSGPLNPLVKDCPNLPIFASHMSHQNVHLMSDMSDMSWSCDINRSHCPVMSSFSLIAVCTLRRQSESRKSAQQPVPSKDMLEKPRMGRFCLRPLVLRCQSKCLPTLCGGIWGAWLLCFEAVLSYQGTTGLILMFLIEMRWLKDLLTLWKNAWWKSYLPTFKQWSDTKLDDQHDKSMKGYQTLQDFAHSNSLPSFPAKTRSDGIMGCVLWQGISIIQHFGWSNQPFAWRSPRLLVQPLMSCGLVVTIFVGKFSCWMVQAFHVPELSIVHHCLVRQWHLIGHACSSGGHAWSKWRISGAICVGTQMDAVGTQRPIERFCMTCVEW